MTTKHTPGPWNYINWGETITINNKDLNMRICKINPFGNSASGIPDEVDTANAKLIVAAPEMLYQLQRIAVLLQQDYDLKMQLDIYQIELAIKKATE